MVESECGRYIKHINDLLKKRANNSLRKEGLTLMQSHVLLKLESAPDHKMTFKEIEKDLHVAQSTTAGLLGRLQEKNLIKCCNDPKDKRIRVACLTTCGESHCDNARRNIAESDMLMFNNFTKEELDTLIVLLSKVYENLENEGKEKE